MIRLLLAAATTVAIVLFAMANGHHVEVSCVVGQPIRIRLIFLVASAFCAGMVCAYFYQLIGQLGRRHGRAVIEHDEEVE